MKTIPPKGVRTVSVDLANFERTFAGTLVLHTPDNYRATHNQYRTNTLMPERPLCSLMAARVSNTHTVSIESIHRHHLPIYVTDCVGVALIEAEPNGRADSQKVRCCVHTPHDDSDYILHKPN